MARPKKNEKEKCIRKDVSFEPEQYAELLAYCGEEERPISWVIRQALKLYLSAQ